jgi:hypothetical protein
MEVGYVMGFTHFYEHPDDDAEETTEFVRR